MVWRRIQQNFYERGNMFSKNNGDGGAHRRGPGMPTIISPGMRVTGNLFSEDGELQIEGFIDGDIKCNAVVVGADSAVTGTIECEDVRVLGTVKGEIRAKTVFLGASARISGDIVHESVSVEPGAYVEGQFKRLDAAKSKIAVVAGGSAAANGKKASKP